MNVRHVNGTGNCAPEFHGAVGDGTGNRKRNTEEQEVRAK